MNNQGIHGPFPPVILGLGESCEECKQPRQIGRKPTRQGKGPTWPHCTSCWARAAGPVFPHCDSVNEPTWDEDEDEED